MESVGLYSMGEIGHFNKGGSAESLTNESPSQNSKITTPEL